VGTLVHSVLERINFAEPGRMEALVDAGMATLIESGDVEIRDAALGRLRRLLESDLPAELAGAKRIFRELDFLLRWPVDGLAGASRDAEEALLGKPAVAPRAQTGSGISASARAVQRSLFDVPPASAEGDSRAAEAPIAVTISGQIDCLYQTAGGQWRIIDYKTGRLPAGGIEATKGEYELQVALYALAVRELIGSLPERAELVLLQRDVRRVPIELSERFLAQASRRIDTAIAEIRAGN
jgi:ATP-dependent exoDNAse (exonuclease V) beta subunit